MSARELKVSINDRPVGMPNETRAMLAGEMRLLRAIQHIVIRDMTAKLKTIAPVPTPASEFHQSTT